MSLTPEERKRIYEEEEARIRAERAARMQALLRRWEKLRRFVARQFVFAFGLAIIFAMAGTVAYQYYQDSRVTVTMEVDVLCSDPQHRGSPCLSSATRTLTVARKDAGQYVLSERHVVCDKCQARRATQERTEKIQHAAEERAAKAQRATEEAILIIKSAKYTYHGASDDYAAVCVYYAWAMYEDADFTGWDAQPLSGSPGVFSVTARFSASAVRPSILDAPAQECSPQVKRMLRAAIPELRLTWRVNTTSTTVAPYNYYARDSLTVYQMMCSQGTAALRELRDLGLIED